MSKNQTCRFIFNDDFEYKDLEPVFPDILRYILKVNEHMLNPEDEEVREMFVELNMQDIVNNRKPEGYNRKGRFRLIFPLGAKEFNVKQFIPKGTDIKVVGTTIGDFLSTANIKFEMKQGYSISIIPGSEDAFTIMDHNSEVNFDELHDFGKLLRANIKIKKPQKNKRFGYITNGEFHEITVEGESVSRSIEIVDDIAFGYM